nr:tRNA pseudouridine synthase 1 [Polyrhizophydium stewartii]
MEQLQIDNADGETHEDRGFVSRMFASFANAFRGKKAWPSGSDQLKAHLSATLQRSKSYPAPRGQDLRSAAKDAALEPELADDSIVGTLKRSLSRHRNFDPREFHSEVETRFFDPLDIPAPNSEQRASMRGYRMTKSQKEALRNIIALFNGTHNWHNYIPGASHDDSRCYIRILNLDLTDVEQHDGMEWIRFKVQAPAFARYQIRRMVALMIMVVRTNTPRSVIANSYGIAKIEIPEAPGFPLIFDEPHFNNYNVEALKKAAEPVNFGPSIEAVEAFRRDAIHNAIYAYERDAMEFDSWLRSLDNYSFLYTYFLNERGVISKPGNFVRQPDAKAATVAA